MRSAREIDEGDTPYVRDLKIRLAAEEEREKRRKAAKAAELAAQDPTPWVVGSPTKAVLGRYATRTEARAARPAGGQVWLQPRKRAVPVDQTWVVLAPDGSVVGRYATRDQARANRPIRGRVELAPSVGGS